MSISARAKHVMGAMLIVVFAFSASSWATSDWTTHCSKQVDDCCTTAVITCCGPSAPVPIGRPALPEFAPPPPHVSTAALMDHSLRPTPAVCAAHVPSPHWVRVLDLPTLHRSFVI